ncbi:MAG: GGDEF domain-containing protein [Treponema sp.]|uniref:GGDEF domain-containing protein n=1 Tax=Treponema sp. TaxID=166 RepID=UPI00298EA2A6|nr:GGDEF domain-containing protein [Treponema sp.]MBR5933075.1 GGDEF domain-containing protein [Treponema sp.]
MGRKFRIGVLINNMYSDYGSNVIEGIEKFCKEHDCNQIIFPLLRGNALSKYDFHYNSLSRLINPGNIDVLIICSAALSNYKNFAEFKKEIENFPPMTKVSLGFNLDGIPSIHVDPSKAIETLVTHVINEHGRKDFLLFQASDESYESRERRRFFESALEKNNVQLDKSKIIDGEFEYNSAYEALAKYLKEHDGKNNFNAVFCCNDDMAMGCMDCLEENGIKVPEDVSVLGFDNIYDACEKEHNISTVDQLIEKQAYECAKLGYELFYKKTKEQNIVFDAVPIIRKSCGCTGHHNQEKVFLENKEYLEKDKYHYDGSLQLYNLHFFLIEAQEPVPLEKLYSRLLYSFYLFDISDAILVLYNKPVYFSDSNGFTFPEDAVIKMTYKNGKGISQPDIYFNPCDYMIPSKCDKSISPLQVIFPLFAGNFQYGYFILSLGKYEKIFYQTAYELISKEIVASIKLSQANREKASLETKNISLEEYSEKLHTLSRTDEMTQLFNRRGFYEAAQVIISQYVSIGKKGLVIFSDMDGLKSINDTFGHEAGDRAIKAQASILKKIFKATDVIGRLGGDEFAIVVPDMDISDFPTKKEQLNNECRKYNEREIDPFVLSISMGCTEFSINTSDIDNLLKKADSELYKEKREKKHSR